MIKYIIIETSLFNAQMKAALKGYRRPLSAHFIQDKVETVRELKLKNDPKNYNLLKWEDSLGKPPGVLPNFSETAQNPRFKIREEADMNNYLLTNVEIPQEILDAIA